MVASSDSATRGILLAKRRETALITGASGGIGLELAQVFAEQGFDLIVVARRASELETLAERCRRDHGVRVDVRPTDLLAAEAPEKLVQQLDDDDVEVDVLVNNAGLMEMGGFAPLFTTASDDVDICWRLQEHGYRIGFSPSAMVWTYPRTTTRDYLKQQMGYGQAEAFLERKHPEYFNTLGSSIWHGRIYNSSNRGVIPGRPIIYHGIFATGFFQTLYAETRPRLRRV